MRNLLLSAATVLMAGSGICRLRPIGRAAQGGGSQYRARARRFRRPDELAAGCRYSHEEGLQRHARRKSAHLARRRRRCHQTGAGEAGRQDRSGRPLLGRRGHHASRQRSQGLGAGLCLRVRARRGTISGVPRQEPVRPTEGGSAIHPDDKGNLYIDPKVFPSAVAADLPPEIAESLATSQLPLNHMAFEAPVDTAAWRDKPTFYVISTKDKVIAPEAQKLFAAEDEGADDGSRRQPCLARRPCEGSRCGHRKGRAREVTVPLPALSRRERTGSLRGMQNAFPHSIISCQASGG